MEFLRVGSYGAPAAIASDRRQFLIVADHVRSPTLVIDAETGEVAQRLAYDARGQLLESSNPGFQPFGFSGGLLDSWTGLVHLGTREYDPRIGRWISPDPLLFHGGSPNLYSYAAQDPVNHWDPTGTEVWRCEQLSGIPWQAEVGLQHHWIKTDSVEAGMGFHPNPPADSSWPGAETAVTDHTGRHKDATCEKIDNVDEECVDKRLKLNRTTASGERYGADLGWYSPLNQCQSFAGDVLGSCAGTPDWGDYSQYIPTGEKTHPEPQPWRNYTPELTYTPDPGYTPAFEELSGLWE